MTFRISNIYKSLVRHVVETMEEIQRRGVSTNIQYHDWDSRGDEAELPNVDLIGLSGFTFSENRGLWIVHCGITLSTMNDNNLIREIELIDVIHDYWGEALTIPLRNDVGEEHSQLMVDEFEMLAAGTSEKRNYRSIGLALMRTANDGA